MLDKVIQRVFGKSNPTPAAEEFIQAVSSHAHQSLSENKEEVNLDAVLSNVVSINQVGHLFSDEEKEYIMKRLNLEFLKSEDDLPFTATFMFEQIENFSLDEAYKVMKETLVEHEGDINFGDKVEADFKKFIALYEITSDTKEKLNDAFETSSDKELNEKGGAVNVDAQEADDHTGEEEYSHLDWKFLARVEAGLVAFWSPYPEVRAVTFPYDDPNERAETFRAYVVSCIWQCIGTFINTYFSARQPPISFSSAIGQVFIYPTGLAMALILPKWTIPLPFGKKIELNPGPWSYKEQMFASLIYFVAGLSNNIYGIIYAQKVKIFLYTPWDDWGYEILLGISSSYMGFGIAGLMRSLYVYPTRAMWPTMLPTVAVNDALMAKEKKENIHGWTLSRYTFFFIVFTFSFIYFWIPDYLFPALSTFSWLSWISPNNLTLDAITGFNGGLGLNPIPSFDFNILLSSGPLAAPVFTTILSYIGSLLAFVAIAIMWFTNYKWTGYFPINSQDLFDNTGNSYDIQKVVDQNNRFVEENYKKYSPPFYSAGLLMSYGAGFASVPLTVVYVSGVYYRQLLDGLKIVGKVLVSRKGSSFKNFNDPFCRMNSAYAEAPEWWFLVVLVISIVLAIVCFEIYPTGTPVWTIFFALGINTIFMVPFLQVYSTTGAYVSLSTVVELIIGYAVRGNGISVLIGSLYGYAIDEQAQNYITNQKIAHYAKVPPRAMFRGQLLTTFINIIITIAVVNWQATFPDICASDQPDKFTCVGTRSTYNTAISWGVIGPYRVIEVLYPILKYCFLIGFLVGFPCVLFQWYAPKKYTKYFQPVVILLGFAIYAPYNLSYYTGGLYFSIAFMKVIKDKYRAWWSKYNYLFQAGIEAGIAFASVIIFFSLMYNPKNISWWGVNVVGEGYDGIGGAPRLIATDQPGGYIGPRYGEFN